MDASNNLVVPADAKPGTYEVVVEVCLVAVPTECIKRTIEVEVVGDLTPTDSVVVTDPVVPGGVVAPSVIDGIKQDDKPVDSKDVTTKIIDDGGLDGVTLDASNNLVVPADAKPGIYNVVVEVCLNSNPNVCITRTIVVNVVDPCELNGDSDSCDIIVYNAFSPNNDASNINESFMIKGIHKYPDNTVEIYNNWGVLVFEAQGYDNEEKAFKGVSEGRATISRDKGLSIGNYFYVIKYKNPVSGVVKEKAGFLYLSR